MILIDPDTRRVLIGWQNRDPDAALRCGTVTSDSKLDAVRTRPGSSDADDQGPLTVRAARARSPVSAPNIILHHCSLRI